MDPDYYIPFVLERVKKEDLEAIYNVSGWEDWEDFLTKLAQKTGKLMKGGQPDFKVVSKMVISDW